MIIRFIMCFFSAIALSIRFELPEGLEQITGGSRILEVFYNLQSSLSGTIVTGTILFVVLILTEIYIRKKEVKRDLILYLICFGIAIIWAMAESFRRVNSLELLHVSIGQSIKTLIYIVGITNFLSELASLLTIFVESKWDFKRKSALLKKMHLKHSFIIYFFGLFICWFPNLVLSYPAAMCPDAWNQLAQFYGEQKFTAHHPPVHTILIGLSEKIGHMFGDGNAGLFSFIFIQTIIFACVLAYMLNTMQKFSAPLWLTRLTFVIAIISPYYTEYIGLILKDNIYSYFIILFVIELFYILLLKQEFWKNKKHVFLFMLSTIGSILFRNNGKYIIYPMMLLIIITCIIQNKEKLYKRTFFQIIIICIISVGISSGIQQGVVQYYQIEEGSISEALSFPFQQTARYVKKYREEVTKEEKKAINAVLSYNDLAERYDPRISDPVKGTYKETASVKDLINYFKVWFQQGLKHPITYIEATMNQNYYLLYPLKEDSTIYDTSDTDMESLVWFEDNLGIHEIPVIQKIDKIRTGFNQVLFTLPVIGLLSNIAFFNLILIYLCYESIRRKIVEMTFVLAPLLLSDIVIVLAPVIFGHPRYAFPILYSLPFVFAVFLYYRRIRETDGIIGSIE